MSELSVWDLDGTIRPGSLMGDAMTYAAEQGIIDSSRYSGAVIPSMDEIRQFIVDLTGRSVEGLRGLLDKLADEAPLQAYPWSLSQIKEQAKSGNVIIVSMSPSLLVKAYCEGLGIKSGFAKGGFLHTKGDIFSGRKVAPNKPAVLQRFMREHGPASVDFAAGDSLSDGPVLARATRAVAVNPDEGLAALAEKNRWEAVRISMESAEAIALGRTAIL